MVRRVLAAMLVAVPAGCGSDSGGADSGGTESAGTEGTAGGTDGSTGGSTGGEPLDDMMEIPAGDYLVGCFDDTEREPADWHVEGPKGCHLTNRVGHTVYLDAYYIDTREVSFAEFSAWAKDVSFEGPDPASELTFGELDLATVLAWYWTGDWDLDGADPSRPVVGVNWEWARDYCVDQGKRLPTEAEWEVAARGGATHQIYPWGNDAPTCNHLPVSEPTCEQKVISTAPVESWTDAQSPHGALHMAGNVAEWTNDRFGVANHVLDANEGVVKNPVGRGSSWQRVIKGNAITAEEIESMSYRRLGWPWVNRRSNSLETGPRQAHWDVGFRCVRPQGPLPDCGNGMRETGERCDPGLDADCSPDCEPRGAEVWNVSRKGPPMVTGGGGLHHMVPRDVVVSSLSSTTVYGVGTTNDRLFLLGVNLATMPRPELGDLELWVLPDEGIGLDVEAAAAGPGGDIVVASNRDTDWVVQRYAWFQGLHDQGKGLVWTGDIGDQSHGFDAVNDVAYHAGTESIIAVGRRTLQAGESGRFHVVRLDANTGQRVWEWPLPSDPDIGAEAAAVWVADDGTITVGGRAPGPIYNSQAYMTRLSIDGVPGDYYTLEADMIRDLIVDPDTGDVLMLSGGTLIRVAAGLEGDPLNELDLSPDGNVTPALLLDDGALFVTNGKQLLSRYDLDFNLEWELPTANRHQPIRLFSAAGNIHWMGTVRELWELGPNNGGINAAFIAFAQIIP